MIIMMMILTLRGAFKSIFPGGGEGGVGSTLDIT